jgi:multiple sugar transport system substrate-binding protein
MLPSLRPYIVSLAGAAVLCAAVAPACGKPRPEDGAAPASAAASAAATAGDTDASSARFQTGLTVDVLTVRGPQIAEPLLRRAAEFRARTGVDVRVHTVPFRELYPLMLDDLRSQSQKYQAYVFVSQWLTDFVAPGFLAELDARIAADPELAWDDIASFFRDFGATYDGRTYAVPLDGDFQMVYYRTDLLAAAGLEPPRTWDDYLILARTFHGRDFDGDEVPDYGSCISKRPGAQAYYVMWSIAGSYLQTQGTRQGAFFDEGTMAPLTNNAAFARALEIYRATGEYGPPEERQLEHGAMRDLYVSGRCALTVDWGDIGTMAIAPQSRVQDLIGAVILPGTREVLDRKTGKLVPCTKLTCPYAVAGVNHAPHAATGGWSGAIASAAPPQVQEAAFAFLSYVSQPAQSSRDVTVGATGFNPYRKSHLRDRAPWIAAGMSEAAAARYLGAIGLSLTSPNMVLDLRIQNGRSYQQEVLDRALDAFLAGARTHTETIRDITTGWNRVTNELGREAQRHAYRASLGLAR